MIVFSGLWCCADRNGLVEYNLARLKSSIRPYARRSIKGPIDALAEAGFIEIIPCGDGHVISIPNFDKHQKPHPNERPSLPSLRHPSALLGTYLGSQSENKVQESFCSDKKTKGISADTRIPAVTKGAILSIHSPLSIQSTLTTESHLASRLSSDVQVDESAAWLDRIYSLYPETGRGDKDQIARVLIGYDITTDAALRDQIEASLREWVESGDWTKDRGKFVPSMLKWVTGKKWDAKPREPKREYSDGITPFDPNTAIGYGRKS